MLLRQFDYHDDATLWECADRLEEAVGNTGQLEFAKLERALGLNYNPNAVLHNKALRQFVKPISTTMYYPLHVWLVNGIANWDIHNSLAHAKVVFGVGSPELHQYMSVWHWPSNVAHPPKNALGTGREKASSDHFKGGASEILSLYPVLRHFVVNIILPLQAAGDHMVLQIGIWSPATAGTVCILPPPVVGFKP